MGINFSKEIQKIIPKENKKIQPKTNSTLETEKITANILGRKWESLFD